MAVSQQDIQNSERLLDLSNQLNDSIVERRKLLKGLSAEEQLYFNTVKQQQKLSQEIAANAEKYLGYQIKSKDLAKQIKATEDNVNKSKIAFGAIEQKLLNNKNKAVLEARKLAQQERKLKQQSLDIEEHSNILQFAKQQALKVGNRELARQIQQEIKANDIAANALYKRIEFNKKQTQQQIDIINNVKKIAKDAKEAEEAQQKELAFLERNLYVRKQIEKSTGLLGGLSKALSKIPGIGQYLNADEAIDEMEKLAASIEEAGGKSTSFSNRLKIGLKGATTLAKGFYENIKSPEAVFTFIVTQATKANEQAVELGKALGYGVDRANRLRENFAFIAGTSSNINATSKTIVEAFSQLVQTTGFASKFTADQLETQIKLTKQVGLQADEAAQIQRFSVLTGKSSEETYRSFVRGLTAARNQLRVGINFKAALAEAAKVSGQLAANLGYNPERIAKAVVTAKAFGMTLEQVAKSGEALLNFEQSIDSELKAELLTGKQLNLERARAAALAGDQVALAEELAKNVGTAADFAKMNTLQQKALAESVGMTADELSETLRKREEAIASGKSLAQITEEEAAQALERQTIQDKFAASLLKIQDVVGNLVAGPFGQLFDLISNIAKILTTVISPVITGVSYVVGLIVDGFKTLSPILLGIGGLLGVIYAKSIATAVANVATAAWSAFIGIPFAGPILATAATLAGVGLVTRLAKGTAFADGGIVTGEINNATVGEAGPEAIIPLNSPKADKILGGGGSIDLTPMIAAISEVKAAVNNLVNRPVEVNLDGKRVGSGLTQGSYKVA